MRSIRFIESLFILTIIFLTYTANSQQPKPPVAILDYSETYKGVAVEIKVLKNDWGEDSHDIRVAYSSSSDNGYSVHTDSTVIYFPYNFDYYPNFFTGTDTIYYRIRDIENDLLSELTPIIISVFQFEFVNNINHLAINNYYITLAPTGNYFWDNQNTFQSLNFIPNGQSTSTLKDSQLMICGKSSQSNHLLTMQNAYNMAMIHESDYMPGPCSIIPENPIDYFSSWNRVWKINKNEIIDHKYNWYNPNYEIPEAILHWPGNRINTNGSLEQLANYVDENQNGYYDPLFGDYPIIPGDEAVFMLFNDNMSAQVYSHGNSLGIEVHQLSYEFNCPEDSIFYNSFFVKYQIINKSDYDIYDFYAAINTHFQIGNPMDNYVGCDTMLNCFYSYNDSIDNVYVYNPVFGISPPAQAVCFLNKKLSSFISPHYIYGQEAIQVMQGSWNGYEPLTYGGDGHGGNEITKFLYPGNPSDPEEWSNIQTTPEIFFFGPSVGSTGPYYLSVGDTIELDIAYVFARDYFGTNLTSVDLLKERLAQLKWYYDNDSTPCGSSWSKIHKNSIREKELKVYPNPASTFLNIRSDIFAKAEYRIYAISGHEIKHGFMANRAIIDISDISQGIYILRLNTDSGIKTTRFIKR